MSPSAGLLGAVDCTATTETAPAAIFEAVTAPSTSLAVETLPSGGTTVEPTGLIVFTNMLPVPDEGAAVKVNVVPLTA